MTMKPKTVPVLIEPMSPATEPACRRMALAAFSDDPVDCIHKCFDVGLDPAAQSEWMAAGIPCDSIEYWVATGSEVLGVIGIYVDSNDPPGAAWLSWFCVDPAQRGRGIGKALLDHMIQVCRDRGMTLLKVYTADTEDEAVAAILYDRRGFIVDRIEPSGTYNLVFRSLKL